MVRHMVPVACFAIVLCIVAGNCSNNSSPTQPQQQNPPPAPLLTAVPPSASVTAGGEQNISISGGVPPYGILSPPNSIAAAQLVNPDSLIATLQITGVTVASVSTAVTVKDNSTPSPKVVTVPIRVQ